MTYRICSFIIALILCSCTLSPKTAEVVEPTIFDNATLLDSASGNFRGENTSDTVEIFHIAERDSTMTIIDERYILIINRDKNTILESRNRLSHLTLEGDINNDGHDEVGIYTEKGNATWGEYSTMHFTDTWHNITTTTLNLHLLTKMGSELDFNEIINPDSLHQGHIIIKRPQIRNAEKIEIVTETITL